MSGTTNRSFSSNWRTRDSAEPAAPSTAKHPSSGQERLAASSWRTKDVSSSNAEPEPERRGNWVRHSRPYDRERTNKQPQRDEDAAATAIAEGRRIYIGNLRYLAKPDDIEGLLHANDLGDFEKIHISIDPFTGRNPSYCFVEFPDKESASRAMTTLEGQLLLGREVKCRPCIPKGGLSGGRRNDAPSRWGNWSGEKNSSYREDEPASDPSLKANDVPSSFSRHEKDFSGQRLYVGGLPRMHDQATNFAEISELFGDYKIDAISKRISAHPSTRTKPGQHDFCFVDFATPEDAKAAKDAVDGTYFRGGHVKVSFASGRSSKWQERESLDNTTT
ncbi:Protein YAE1 [Parahypoxylon ruwenzoriense]